MATIEELAASISLQAGRALELYQKGDKAEAAMLFDEVAEEACVARDEVSEEVSPEEWDALVKEQDLRKPKAKV